MEESKKDTKEQEGKASDMEYEQSEKEVLERVAVLLREDLVATFQKDSDRSMLIRSVGGKQFRIQIEEVV
ncbi:MAG: hypothetical protein IJ506_06120 [Clostridia bacterium]|nr:hypothetical protein [Clostridia bacterium]